MDRRDRQARQARRARRDRHGRGMRGPLAHPPVPLARTRREDFGDLVIDAAERIGTYVAEELGSALAETGLRIEDVAFAVEDVPPPAGSAPAADPHRTPSLEEVGLDVVPLGRVDRRAGERPPTVVVYRRPVELRTDSDDERAELVHDVLVEQLAELLDLDPDDIDPGYGD